MLLEKYLEKDLVRKFKIANLLWENDILTSIDLACALNVTTTTIKSDIKNINMFYCPSNEPLVISETTGYSILNKKSCNKKNFFRQLYNSSLFIKACCFYLKNDFKETEKFALQEFISVSKAYELKNKVLVYLKELDIYIDDRKSECRIRFLIAYFQMKLGIQVVEISKHKQFIFDRLIEEVEKLEGCFFSNYSKEYAYVLLQLNFKRRKNNPVYFNNKEVNLLKETIIYKRLYNPVFKLLKNELHININEHEILYCMTVINIMNANYYENKESLEIHEYYANLISKLVNYKELLALFDEEFNSVLSKNHLFQAVLVLFLRKSLFNLQILIPEEHIELGNYATIPSSLVEQTEKVLNKWQEKNKLNLQFSIEHVRYLASKLYFIVKRKKRPRVIYLLCNFYPDYLLAKEILQIEFGTFVEVMQFPSSLSNVYFHRDDLILYDIYSPVLKKTGCKLLKISYIFDLKELQKIGAQLFEYDLKDIDRKEF
ncbi:hypothetical protein ACG7XA_002642 [Enterococcus faecium]